MTAPKLIAMGSPKTDPRVAELMKAYGLELTDAMAKEGYVLGIGADGIVIGAETARGLLYGTATCAQMLVYRGRGEHPAGGAAPARLAEDGNGAASTTSSAMARSRRWKTSRT